MAEKLTIKDVRVRRDGYFVRRRDGALIGLWWKRGRKFASATAEMEGLAIYDSQTDALVALLDKVNGDA